MLNCYHPNTLLSGPPIRCLKIGGATAPKPADMVLSSSDPRVTFTDFGSWTRIARSVSLAVGEALTATVKARSESLGIEDTALVTFHGPPPDVAEVLDIDEPGYSEGVD